MKKYVTLALLASFWTAQALAKIELPAKLKKDSPLLIEMFQKRIDAQKEKAKKAITDDEFQEAKGFIKEAIKNQEIIKMLQNKE